MTLEVILEDYVQYLSSFSVRVNWRYKNILLVAGLKKL